MYIAIKQSLSLLLFLHLASEQTQLKHEYCLLLPKLNLEAYLYTYFELYPPPSPGCQLASPLVRASVLTNEVSG